MSLIESIKAGISREKLEKEEHILESSICYLYMHIHENLCQYITDIIKHDKSNEEVFITPMYNENMNAIKYFGTRQTPKAYLHRVLDDTRIKLLIEEINEVYKPIKVSISANIFGVICLDIKYKDTIFQKLGKSIVSLFNTND